MERVSIDKVARIISLRSKKKKKKKKERGIKSLFFDIRYSNILARRSNLITINRNNNSSFFLITTKERFEVNAVENNRTANASNIEINSRTTSKRKPRNNRERGVTINKLYRVAFENG